MKNNEYLSVKQFSERAGVSSQAVYKQLNNKLKKFKKVENGKTYVNIRGLSYFVSTNSTNVVQPVEQLSTNVEQPVEQMIELLKEQLKAKDELNGHIPLKRVVTAMIRGIIFIRIFPKTLLIRLAVKRKQGQYII